MSIHQKIIITGPPSSGKTTVLQALQNEGYECLDEIARKVIKDQQQIGSKLVPWDDVVGFSQLVYQDFLKQKELIFEGETVFSDRGILDIKAYLLLANQGHAMNLGNACDGMCYSSKVFLLPVWEEIYSQDEQRKESVDEAIKLYNLLEKVYEEAGFKVVLVPKVSVSERVEFILKEVKQ